MTREETQEILMVIQAAYPNYKPQNKTFTINIWYQSLQEYDYRQVSMALRAYITSDNSGFAPSIGQLIEKAQMISQPRELSEMEAWMLVSRALRNGYYGAEQEFDRLPPLVQKAVGAPEQLRNWSQTDMESIENVVQSNFMRTYRSVAARETQIAKMPEDIRGLIGKTCGEMERLFCRDAIQEKEEQTVRQAGVPMPQEKKARLLELLDAGHGGESSGV